MACLVHIVLVLPMAVDVIDHSLILETFFSFGGHYSEPPILLSLWLLGELTQLGAFF